MGSRPSFATLEGRRQWAARHSLQASILITTVINIVFCVGLTTTGLPAIAIVVVGCLFEVLCAYIGFRQLRTAYAHLRDET
jgi:hypothetical protein